LAAGEKYNGRNSREHMWKIKRTAYCVDKETWWWNDEVADAVKVKKVLYRN